MHDLALKMLFGDRAKYIMLISGLTFAGLLMTQQASIFCGIMQWTGSTLTNVPAPIWVVDPMVEQVNDTDALRDKGDAVEDHLKKEADELGKDTRNMPKADQPKN